MVLQPHFKVVLFSAYLARLIDPRSSENLAAEFWYDYFVHHYREQFLCPVEVYRYEMQQNCKARTADKSDITAGSV